MIHLLNIPSKEINKQENYFHSDFALGGFARSLANHTSYKINGKKIDVSIAYKSNAYNNQIIVSIKENGKPIRTLEFGGTNNPEPLNHAFPLSYYLSADNSLVVFQNIFHVNPVRYWKINLATYEVTYENQFGTDYSYLDLKNVDGYDFTFTVRKGSGSSGYHQAIAKVNVNTGVWSELQLTNAQYGVFNTRDYPTSVPKYGNSIHTVGSLTWRKDLSIAYYANFNWIIKNNSYGVFYNTDLTTSKDVPANGIISRTELANNYLSVGTPEDNTTHLTEPRKIHVHEDIFTIYKSQNAVNSFGDIDYVPMKYTIQKETIGSTTKSTFEFPLNDIYDGGIDNVSTMIWNGYNIVISLKCYTGIVSETRVFGISTNFTNWTHFETYSEAQVPDGQYFGLPVNLHEIGKNEAYTAWNRSVKGSGGTVTTLRLTNKFKIAS